MRHLKRDFRAHARRATLITVAATSGLGLLVGRGAATAAADTFTYSPTVSTDLWSTGANWSATAPAGGAGTELRFVGVNGTVLPSGLVNTNTNDLPGTFQLNALSLQGTGPAVGGTAAVVNIGAAAPATGLQFVASGGAAPVVNLNANAGTLADGLTYDVTSPVTLGGTTTFGGNGTAGFKFSGVIDGAGGLVKTGQSAVTLSGMNTFAGGVTINGGTVRVDAASTGTAGFPVAGPLGRGVVTMTGGALTGQRFPAPPTRVDNPLVLSGDVRFGERNGDGLGFFGPITLAGDLKVTVETPTSFETVVREAGGSFGLVKEGGETLLLYGPNTFTGPTVINAGIIRYQGGLASIAGTGPNITVNRGGVAEAPAALKLTDLLARIDPSSEGVIAGNLGSNYSYDLDFTNYPNLKFSGGNFSGVITPAGDVYRLGGGRTALSLSRANAVTGDRALYVHVDTTMPANAIVPRIVQLTAANDYTGATRVGPGGTLQLSHSDAIARTSGVVVEDGGSVDLLDGVTIRGRSITIAGRGFTRFGALAATYGSVRPGGGRAEWAGPVILGGNATIGGWPGGSVARSLVVSGVIDDRPTAGSTNAFDLTIRTAGPLDVVLTAPNTYHGDTRVEFGMLRIDGGDDRLPVGTRLVMGRPESGATFDLNGRNQTVAGLVVNGTPPEAKSVRNLKAGTTSTLTVANAIDQAYEGVLSDTHASNGAALAFRKSAGGAFTLAGANSYGGATTVDAGTLRVTSSVAESSGVTVNGGTFEAAGTQAVRRLTVGAAGNARVAAGVLTVGDGSAAAPLDVAAGGGVDVTTRALVVNYAAGAGNDTAAVAGVRGLVTAGRRGGAWDGRGIYSSAAAGDGSAAVGYALAGEALGLGGGAFMGADGVDASSVLVRHTLAGDADLDGAVKFADLVRLAQNYNATVSATTESWWFRGDFTYDGRVDFADLVKLAQNYDAALPDQPVAGAPAGFEADVAAAFAAVPEPACAGWVAAAAFLLGRRRRRYSGGGRGGEFRRG